MYQTEEPNIFETITCMGIVYLSFVKLPVASTPTCMGPLAV